MIGQDKLAAERKRRAFAEYAAGEPLSDDEADAIEAQVLSAIRSTVKSQSDIDAEVSFMLGGPLFAGRKP
jgi:F0F1-type ATP synthase delta subunit